MKILELTNFSAGACGVFNRVKEESIRLSKRGNEVMIFSSNLEKGTNKIVPKSESIGGVKIIRFQSKRLGGESFMSWNFEKEALDFNPDVIIAHSYRHPHTKKALKLAKRLNSRVFLVTHAPFIDKTTKRSFLSNLSVKFYDFFVGPRYLNKFDRIIAITKWEVPYLLNLGVKKEKIIYIPNGIPEEFFSFKKSKSENKILFLGRISPIKNLDLLIKSFSKIKDKEIKIELVGPYEKDYMKKLNDIIDSLEIRNRVKLSKPVYNIKEKIRKLDSCKLFVLPSKSEAMPQSLIEAMARGNLVLTSDNKGSKEIVNNGKNGFLFKNNNLDDLTQKINLCLKEPYKKISNNAQKSVRIFSWKELCPIFEKLIAN